MSTAWPQGGFQLARTRLSYILVRELDNIIALSTYFVNISGNISSHSAGRLIRVPITLGGDLDRGELEAK